MLLKHYKVGLLWVRRRILPRGRFCRQAPFFPNRSPGWGLRYNCLQRQQERWIIEFWTSAAPPCPVADGYGTLPASSQNSSLGQRMLQNRNVGGLRTGSCRAEGQDMGVSDLWKFNMFQPRKAVQQALYFKTVLVHWAQCNSCSVWS